MTAAEDVPAFDPAARRAWPLSEMHRSGLTRRRADSPEWARPHRGVRLWRPPGIREPEDRVFAAALLLPEGSALGGWAAGLLQGIEWADGRGRDGHLLKVPLVVPPHTFVPRRRGIEARRSTLEETDVCLRSGVRVTSGTRTAFDTARRSATLGDAVAWLDCLITAGVTDPAALEAYLAAHRGWVGIARARTALALADARARSPQESRLRVQWLDAGLPPPLVNVKIWTHDGGQVGEADLLDPESGFVAEYDGWMHRRRDRRELDHGRARRFADVGITMRTYVDRDLAGDPRLLHGSLRAGHAAAQRVRRRLWTLDPDCFWD